MNTSIKRNNNCVEIILAQPRGFCAGVNRAISIVEKALILYGAPIYVKHEIVHNSYVVESLRMRGVIFIEKLCDIPDGKTVIFSAHGISDKIKKEAETRKLRVLDATCPLVKKVHAEVKRLNKIGKEIIMIGHKGHPEVEGTLGQIKNGIYLIETLKDIDELKVINSDQLAIVTQTTLSIDDVDILLIALKKRFPFILEPKDDICYATRNRQNAVKILMNDCNPILVIGSKNSSNANRLYEMIKNKGICTYLIDNVKEINLSWLYGKKRIGITSSASTPEILVNQTIETIKKLVGSISIHTIQGPVENILFHIPKIISKQIS